MEEITLDPKYVTIGIFAIFVVAFSYFMTNSGNYGWIQPNVRYDIEVYYENQLRSDKRVYVPIVRFGETRIAEITVSNKYNTPLGFGIVTEVYPPELKPFVQVSFVPAPPFSVKSMSSLIVKVSYLISECNVDLRYADIVFVLKKVT